MADVEKMVGNAGGPEEGYRREGYFVLMSRGTAINPRSGEAVGRREFFRSAHLTEELAIEATTMLKAQTPDDSETEYLIKAPSMNRQHWLTAVLRLSSEFRGVSVEVARADLVASHHELEQLYATRQAPALAAALLSRHDENFDLETWRAEHLPARPDAMVGAEMQDQMEDAPGCP